jgi:hypothetical protein
MFAPVLAILLAFIASVSAGTFAYNNCFGEGVNHFYCNNYYNVPGGAPTAGECSFACNSLTYTKFSFTPGYGNCLCATDSCAAGARTANPGYDSYCVGEAPPQPPLPFVLCDNDKRCGQNQGGNAVVTQPFAFETVEACANTCRSLGGFGYFNYLPDYKQCQCAHTCAPVDYFSQTGSNAYQLDAGACTHGEKAGRLRVR